MADAQDSDSCPRKSGVGSSPIVRSVKTLVKSSFGGFYRGFSFENLEYVKGATAP